MHGAWYVSDAFHREHGRLGRSWGCPAVTEAIARPLIDTIKDGSLLIVYYPDERWLANSYFLNACSQNSSEVSSALSSGISQGAPVTSTGVE